MKTLDLFTGTGSFKSVANSMGFQCLSLDNRELDGVDMVCDFEEWDPGIMPFIPDFVWASPPCTTYSRAAGNFHRYGERALTAFAEKSDRMMLKLLALLKEWSCDFVIENPMGRLRNMSFMSGIPRQTVWYCQYGYKIAKPTDIFSNLNYDLFNQDGFKAKQCYNGNRQCHHEKSPRDYRKAKKLGLHRNGVRAKSKQCISVPPNLIRELLNVSLKIKSYEYQKI